MRVYEGLHSLSPPAGGRAKCQSGKEATLATGGKSLTEAKGRWNVRGSREKLPFIDTFFSFFLFFFCFQVYSQRQSHSQAPSQPETAPGSGRWHPHLPHPPVLSASCMTCIGIHRGAGENPFRCWMQLNSACSLPRLPSSKSARRAPLSSACECCSVSACSDFTNPFFSFPTANAPVVSANISHLAF